jgi:glucose-induced degradation protein 8
MAVKMAVQSGNVQDAIEKINDLNPEVILLILLSFLCPFYIHQQFFCFILGKIYIKQILDTNPELYFHLQQQKLIELIRMGKIEEALVFAQEELAPRGEENVPLLPQFQPVFQLVLIVSLTEEAKIQPEAIRLRPSSLHVGFGSGFLGQCLVRSNLII